MVRSTTLLVVPLLLNGVAAFAPSFSIQRYQCSPTKMNSSPAAPLEAAPLEVVNEEDGSASSDPFDTYTATKDQKSIATRDLSVGSGYTVGSDDSQLLKISFTSKFSLQTLRCVYKNSIQTIWYSKRGNNDVYQAWKRD